MKQLIFIICGFCAISSFGQINNDVNVSFTLFKAAMLDLDNNSTVTLNLSSAIEAGEKAKVLSENNEKWIHFSSAVESDSASRIISVNIDGGQIPSGINLKLSTSNYMGNGKGELGEPSGIRTLTNKPQTIISKIRGAYTGTGNSGYKLTYSLYIYDYALLDFNQTANLTIIYTLSEL